MLNGVNGVSWLSEHPVMPNFEFSALVAAEPSDLLEKQEIEQRNRGANDTETARTRLMGMSQGRAWPVRAPHVRTQPRGTVWHVRYNTAQSVAGTCLARTNTAER